MQNVILKLALTGVLLAATTTVTAPAQTVLDRELDSLFVIASSGEIKYQDARDPAMDEIAALGVGAVPWLIDKFRTKSARERWTVIWIFQRIGSPAVPDLLQALKRTDGLVVQRVCWALGDIKDSSAVEGLIGVCQHDRWQVRDQAMSALGKIGDAAATATIMTGLSDSIGQVRKSAVVSLGQLRADDAVAALVHALGDQFYGARLMAVNSLLSLDTALVMSHLVDSLESRNRLVGDLACQVLGEYGTDDALAALVSQTRSDDPDRRAHAAVALVRADPLDNCGFRKKYYANETDRLVRLKIESAIRTISNETEQAH